MSDLRGNRREELAVQREFTHFVYLVHLEKKSTRQEYRYASAGGEDAQLS